MPEEMQLTFLILVLYCCIQNSKTDLPPYGTPWRRSRYIIDNRRNALFTKKPSSVLFQNPSKEPPILKFGQEGFKQSLLPGYQKDLSAEASISEPKFYEKYNDNTLPGKILKSYKLPGDFDSPYNHRIFQTQKNTTGVLDPQDFIQNENYVDIGSRVMTTTERILTWVPKVSSTASTTKGRQNVESTNQGYEYGIPTTASYPWGIAKTDQANQIDNANEKHVYETRIETVSYHQEVIFNPPKKQNWYERREPKNYEQQEENYEEPEKNYEESGKNYEEPEKNYELDEAVNVMSEGRMPETGDGQNKFGYVVEGSNYRKYRVEERTVDGFIVGEYGVVSHDDGSLRGVRYTADGDTNPKLIYETLIKFLSL